MMKASSILLALITALALTGCNVSVNVGSDCRLTEERSATVPVEDAKSLFVDARAGELRIEGRSDLTQVQAKGAACAGDQNTLDRVVLRAEKVGDEVRVIAEMPDGIVFMGSSPRLDLTLEIPAGMTVRVQDSSGDTIIKNVAGVDVEDDSGSLEIADVAGGVVISDDSGDITIERTGGMVEIRDDSGSIDVREAHADVTVEDDGSGDIEIQQVDGNVVIQNDGSGSIDVQDVKGDFTVDRDGSGGISHRNVGGNVRIPQD